MKIEQTPQGQSILSLLNEDPILSSFLASAMKLKFGDQQAFASLMTNQDNIPHLALLRIEKESSGIGVKIDQIMQHLKELFWGGYKSEDIIAFLSKTEP